MVNKHILINTLALQDLTSMIHLFIFVESPYGSEYLLNLP